MPTTITYKGFFISSCFVSPHTRRICGSQQGWMVSHPAMPDAEKCSPEHRPSPLGWAKRISDAKRNIDEFQQAGIKGKLTAQRCEDFERYWPELPKPTPRVDGAFLNAQQRAAPNESEAITFATGHGIFRVRVRDGVLHIDCDATIMVRPRSGNSIGLYEMREDTDRSMVEPKKS